MKAEDLVAAFARGLMQGLVNVPAAETPSATPRTKARRPRRVADTPAGATVIPGEIPKPSFDQVDEPLPGFENVPRATLREMEAAMEKITRGNEPPPGFYSVDDAKGKNVPLS